jgi:diaminopimelate epimerase
VSAGIAVSKLHGACNDFVILDTRIQSTEEPDAFARWACDRHAGIGADGLLVVGDSKSADVSMRVINADGSEAEMCGNGVRCVARYLDERGEGARRRIETIGGIVDTEVLERGYVYEIRVSVEAPRFVTMEPVFDDGVVVVVGNPHLVVFSDDTSGIDIAAAGQRLQSDARFPEGINLHVCAVENDRTLRVRHYERGAGLTMACGTGAVACAAAAIVRGAARSPVDVCVPGGTLRVEWDGSGNASLTGPAVHVFDTVVNHRLAR